MNNYIVCRDQLKKEFKVNNSPYGEELNSDYKDIIKKGYCSDAIIWNAFAPWGYNDKDKSIFIKKIIDNVFSTILDDTDFTNNTYSFFGHKPSYFKRDKPDLIIDNKKNCLILEAKYTEDSSNRNNIESQIGNYFCDIFFKLCENQVKNPYFIILHPHQTGKYYYYYQLIEKCKGNTYEIESRIKSSLGGRNNKTYRKCYDVCTNKLNDKPEILIQKMSENIGLLSWRELTKILFECIDEKSSVNYCIDDWNQYKKFFSDRVSDDFLLMCYALPRSQKT